RAPKGLPWSATPDKDGNLWMPYYGRGNEVARLNPNTAEVKRVLLPFEESAGVHSSVPTPDGTVWFTEFALNRSAKLDPQTGTIGKIDAKTGKVVHWSPPTHGMPQRLDLDSNGIVYFSERQGNKIGRFDPKTETFKEYPLPGPAGTPYAIAVDKDDTVWYNSNDQDTIGRLDPNTGKIVEYPFPQSDGLMREFFLDSHGRMWFASPTNNRVGYFYLTRKT